MKISKKTSKRLSVITASAIMANMFLIGGLPTSAQTEEDLTFGGLISEEAIAEQGHIAISDKLTDRLDAIEYINEDGTRTVYAFPVPVKYIDDNGEVQPIDNKLDKKFLQNKWTNSANSFDITIDGDIDGGVVLAYDDVSLQSTVNVAAGSIKVDSSSSGITEDKYVEFTGTQSKISVTPTNTGYATYVHLDNFNKNETIVLDISGSEIEQHYVSETGEAVFEMEDGSSVSYSALTYALGEESASWPQVDVAIRGSEADLELVYTVERDDTVTAAESLEMTINSDIE